MDITEYLIRSKSQRKELVNIASAYAFKTIETEAASSVRTPDKSTRPTPQGLKKFETEVNNQLKRIFRPDINVDANYKRQCLSSVNPSERINKIYSSNSHILMKKKNIMLMQKKCKTPLKITLGSLSEKHKAFSPYSPMKDVSKPNIRGLNERIPKLTIQ